MTQLHVRKSRFGLHSKRPRLTDKQKARLFLEREGRCHICTRKIGHREIWEVEHVIAREAGGSDDWSNLAPAHKDCHAGKTKKDRKTIAKVDSLAKKEAGVKKQSKFQTNRDGKFKALIGGGVIRRGD